MSVSLDLKTLEAAATWYVQLNDGELSEARIRAWQVWMQSGPQNAAAWDRVEKLQQQWALIPRRAALSSLGAASTQRRDVLKILGLLLATGACSWLAVEQLPYRPMLAQQRTGLRERRSLQLDDGSHLQLNADTALDIRFDAKQRLIQLYRGEILIETARDPARRPFIVDTGEGRVQALGTRLASANWPGARESGCCKPRCKSVQTAIPIGSCGWRQASKSRLTAMRWMTFTFYPPARPPGYKAC